MHDLKALVLAAMVAGIAAGCTGGNNAFGTNNSPGNGTFTSSNPVMQLAVGTLNDPSGTWNFLCGDGGAPGTYLNAVSTFRQSNGNSAFSTGTGTAGSGTPSSTLMGPVGFASFVDGTQTVVLTNAPRTLYSYGQLAPVNAVAGLPPQYPSAGAPGAGFSTGFLAQVFTNPLGTPTPGQYTVGATVSQNGTTTTITANATLPGSPTVLGPFAAPPAFVPDVAHDGGGTFTLASRPAGVTETLILVFTAAPAQYASVETTGLSAPVPPGTVNTGTSFAVALGADYPLVEAGPPTNTSQSPTITGIGGTADLTFSAFSGPFTR